MEGQKGYNSSRRSENANSAKAGRAIYLRGIPPTWTRESLAEFLGEKWSVESINLLPSKPGHRTLAAFVNFWKACDAEEAVKELDGQILRTEADHFWLGCSFKKDAGKKVDVSCQNYSLPTEILDGFLFLGNRECLANEGELKRLGIDHVLSLTSDQDETFVNAPTWVHRLHLQALDSVEEDLTKLYNPACSFIENARLADGRILVHCVAGRSRSVAIVVAYLMRHRDMRLDSAFDLVKEKRPYAWPNDSFWQQLEAEECRLFHKTSTEVASTKGAKARFSNEHSSSKASAQLLEGSLSRSPKRQIDEFLHDLQHFSSVHGIWAQAEISQDRVDVHGREAASRPEPKCLAELEQIFAFYRFGQVQWCTDNSNKAPVVANVTRW